MTPNTFGGSGVSTTNNTNTEISMRKQTLLRRMWSREFQHSKYSGSWSPPMRRSTHQSQNRLKKFNTLPEFISSTCEKCKELGVLAHSFDEDYSELKDKSQQTDFSLEVNSDKKNKNSSSASSSASTIIQTPKNSTGSDCKETSVNSNSRFIDANGNNIVICMNAMNALEDQRAAINLRNDNEDILHVIEVDDNNNADMLQNTEKFLRKQYSTDLEDRNFILNPDDTAINYKRLREENLNDSEIDQFISQMLIDNLNNVIKTVNENLQANGEHNLVKIDYNPDGSGEGDENGGSGHYNNNKLGNMHENSIQMRIAKNGDTTNNNRNSNEVVSSNYATVERDISENTDVERQRFLYEATELELKQHNFSLYGTDKSLSERSTLDLSDQFELTAVINTGSSYRNLTNPETVLIPRLTGPRTESMEVNPSSSSAQEDDEFDDMPDSDDEDISDVDSLDDLVTLRARKLSDLAHAQHKKAQAIFRQTHLKGQAFFVPIVDTEQPIDEHIVVADTMPEKLKEKLILRQRRRALKKQSEMKIKQWQMQRFIERKMGEVNLVNNYINDFSTGGAFKVIGMPASKKMYAEPKEIYRSQQQPMSSGWVPKTRTAPSAQVNPVEGFTEKSTKSKKLRTEIGMLESYKIDGRGNMQIVAPGKVEKVKPKFKRSTYTSITDSKKPIKPKLKTPSDIQSRKSNPSSKRLSSNIPTSSASSIEAIDVRRRQVMKDVQQMAMYKNDLTPDPDSGPSRKMWKTEIQEGDKHIEILEIVECVDGNTLAHQQMAPEHNFNHLFPPSTATTQNHKYYHVSSSSVHPTIVNKTFSVRTSGFDSENSNSGRKVISKIPVPVYRPIRSRPFIRYDDLSPSNPHSSSTDAEESMTSVESTSTKNSSKVDRMIANLLLEALKSPDEIDFVQSPKMRKPKRKPLSPNGGADSSSTGYYTGDSSSRRSASNSAGKYQHRFEVIPEEKSSFSVDSSNDDFDEDEEDIKNEKLSNINDDWKSKKNLQNNDIKTRNISPEKNEKGIEKEDTEKSRNF